MPKANRRLSCSPLFNLILIITSLKLRPCIRVVIISNNAFPSTTFMTSSLKDSHFILKFSFWLNSLWASKCFWQKVHSHCWHIRKSKMHVLSLHDLLLHTWHLMLWVSHTFFLHFMQLALLLQSLHKIKLHVLQRCLDMSFTAKYLLVLQSTHADFNSSLHFSLISDILVFKNSYSGECLLSFFLEV